MKVKILNEIITETVDAGYLNSIGVTVGKELGSGMFGTVFSVTVNLGSGTREYALKHVEKGSPGYEREKKSYTDIKSFVDMARKNDTEILRIIYPLYII